MSSGNIDRRSFVATGAALALLPGVEARAASLKKTRVGVIGCGSVSTQYFPHLATCEHAEVVSCCDIIPERAAKAAERHKISEHHPNIDAMLAGAPFDLLVNLTDMQAHEGLNRKAIDAGRHVWSEKPMANSLAAGQALLKDAKAKGLRIWGHATVVNSPQFAFMAKAIREGKLGRPSAAHADYGHEGPNWSAFFYEEGGGSLPDLGVYNLTTLTGLLGPAKSVVAMTSIVTPTRAIHGKGEVRVAAEDNAMVVLDHGDGCLSHVQCGFNYFNPHGHDGSKEARHTITIYGTKGCMGLVGYDWAPIAVDLATMDSPEFARQAPDAKGYVWQQGASIAAECLATGKDILVTPEHALHVLEIIAGARESQASGKRVALTSTFRYPVVG